MKLFHSLDKDMMFLKKGFLLLTVFYIVTLTAALFWMVTTVNDERQKVIVVDSNNNTFLGSVATLTKERKKGQLRAHVETFARFFWNVSQERDNLETSVNKALLLADESAVRLYEQYYEVQGLGAFLYANAGESFIAIDSVSINMETRPISGKIWAVNEIETPKAETRRRMDLAFQIRSYPVSYENPVGAQLFNIEVLNDQSINSEGE